MLKKTMMLSLLNVMLGLKALQTTCIPLISLMWDNLSHNESIGRRRTFPVFKVVLLPLFCFSFAYQD